MKIAFLAALMFISAWAQSAAPDPCKLLTPAEISSSLGTGFRPIKVRGECSLVRRSDNVMFSVRKSIRGAPSKDLAFVRSTTPGAKSLPGVCDAAVSRPSGTLFAAKGTWLVSVETDIGNKHDASVAAKLASLLCSHM